MTTIRTASDWDRILRAVGVMQDIAARWAEPFRDEVQPEKFSKGDLDIADWLPNILHESSMLRRMEENLNYSPQRLTEVWPNRFPTLASAIPFGYNPQALANKVYGMRADLGNVQAGDGWTYRGRSPIQITGRANYLRVGQLMGQDLIGIPDLLMQPRFALEACIAWWEDKIPDSMLGETTAIRRRVNGGTLGLDEVQRLTVRVREALHVSVA